MFKKRVSLDNWVKNHKNGLVTTITKVKPATKVKGKAHLQVFNAETGVVEQEAISENVVCDAVNEFFTSQLFCNLLSKSTVHTAFQLFGRIILNNYVTAESASLKYFPDTLTYPTIAWAHRTQTYGGADTVRGTINEVECSYDPSTGEIVMVYDWTTAQGNGTFQSLFWVSDSYNVQSGDTDMHTYMVQEGLFSNMTDDIMEGKGCYVGMKHYYAWNGKIYSVELLRTGTTTYAFYASGVTPTKVEEKDYSGDVISSSLNDGVMWDGTYFYVWCYLDDKVYRYNSSWVLQNSYEMLYPDNCTIAGIEVTPTALFTFKYVSATEINLYKWNSATGALLGTYNMYSDGVTMNPQGIIFDGTNLCIFSVNTSDEIAVYDTSGNFITQVKTTSANAFSFSHSMSYIPSIGAVHASYEDDSARLYKFNLGPVAHNLLAAPVVKTSANTMKLTYTFTLDLSDV